MTGDQTEAQFGAIHDAVLALADAGETKNLAATDGHLFTVTGSPSRGAGWTPQLVASQAGAIAQGDRMPAGGIAIISTIGNEVFAVVRITK